MHACFASLKFFPPYVVFIPFWWIGWLLVVWGDKLTKIWQDGLFIFHFILVVLPHNIVQKWRKNKNEVTKTCNEPGISFNFSCDKWENLHCHFFFHERNEKKIFHSCLFILIYSFIWELREGRIGLEKNKEGKAITNYP